ncbi:hypothetical protein VOI54_05115 [Tamlana sp. 2201CG12-4]|uniref:hypothetical protein n=1 Tax=Tamlana sp. 2201CG12-4 TaxID=3112582 RepID=UPI002DBC3D66|nr:hypothetical protein [Tamlana sp. 2201CG12-4]MEC3906387.1 hypothetical protein [Tamlana sp. 2201CG12-4]
MKNVIKHLKKGFLMVTLFATLLSFATDASSFKIKNEAKRTSLTLYHIKKGDLLSIKDENGNILYKESMQTTGVYTKGFDLTTLPNGSYMFEVDKDLEINIIPFTVKHNVVLFDKEKKETIFKPFVRIKGDLIFVSKLSLDKTPLHIDFYRTDVSNSGHIYSEKIENTKVIERVYKLRGLDEGHFKIVFHTKGREFTKKIN